MKRASYVLTLACAVVLASPFLIQAQELEPRLYQNVPVGLNAVLFGYGFSTGNVLFDSTLPIEDGDADVRTFSAAYIRTLDFFGRTGKVDIVLPFSDANFQGIVDGEFRTRTPTGFADPRVRLAVNLTGSPPLSGQEFATYRQQTIVGVSLQVIVPLGQYDATKLINLGSNRWSFRPEAAVSHRLRSWFLEVAGGAWFFTSNENFFGGQTLEQSPLYYIKGDIIYNFRFRRGLWLSFNGGWASGGETTVDGVFAANLQRNTRIGSTLNIPLTPQNSLKVVYTSGLATRLGPDFDSLNFVYQFTWGDARRSSGGQ